MATLAQLRKQAKDLGVPPRFHPAVILDHAPEHDR